MPHETRNHQGSNTDADFWANYSSATPRLATMVKITAREEFGGDVLGFTSNTRNMTLPGHAGVTFKSAPGIMPDTVEIALDEPVNLEMLGIYTADFPRNEVIAGKWNFARVEIFVVCWDDTDLGEWLVCETLTGEIKDYQTHFNTELRGKLSLLSNETGIITQSLCRVRRFGDADCKKNLNTTVTIDGTAYNITQTPVTVSAFDTANPYQIVFTKLAGTANDPPDDFFRNGEIIALGATDNGELSREIKSSDTQASNIVVNLKRKFPFAVEVGHTFTLIAGCDRTIENCMLYANIINRRAEDWLPGDEAVNRIQSAN